MLLILITSNWHHQLTEAASALLKGTAEVTDRPWDRTGWDPCACPSLAFQRNKAGYSLWQYITTFHMAFGEKCAGNEVFCSQEEVFCSTHVDETGDGNDLWLIMAGKKWLDKFSNVKSKGKFYFFFQILLVFIFRKLGDDVHIFSIVHLNKCCVFSIF